MPTYDYICKACGANLEMFQSITESAKRKCPECGKLKLERQIGAGAGILFKGSGYYQTDYRSDSYKKAAEADSKAASETTEPKQPAASDAKAPKPSSGGDAKPKDAKGVTKKKSGRD